MPAYFYVEQSAGIDYFTCTAAQTSETDEATEVGKWTTGLSTAVTNAFNTGETDSREQLDVKLNFCSLYADQVGDVNGHNVEFKITLMGSDAASGTFESQGITYTRNISAADGEVTTSEGNPIERDSGGTLVADIVYTFMLKKKFWFVKVSMKVSAFIKIGDTNNVNIYGFVAIDDDGITRKKYKTKTFMHGHGLQVMTGPKSFVRFGRNQNLIYGDLNIEGDAEGGGSGYFQNNLTVGTNETITTHPLYVDGDIAATGNIIAYVSSDERLKANITPLEDSLEKVKKLTPIDFSWKNRDTGWGTESPADIGLIAQEVEKDFPSLVGKMGDGYKGIRYDRMVPVLIDCIKTQDKKIERLENLVERLINKSEVE